MTKLTKQGVRDLGGIIPPRKKVVYQCPHVWEREQDWCSVFDPPMDRPQAYQRCGLCKETRR